MNALPRDNEVTSAAECFAWLGKNYPNAALKFEILSHNIDANPANITAKGYVTDMYGNVIAENIRMKFAEHNADEDYVGWAVTAAMARAVKNLMAIAGVASEVYTAEEYTRLMERKLLMLDETFATGGSRAAKKMVDEENDEGIRRRLGQRLESKMSEAAMQEMELPVKRAASKPGKKLPY